MDSSANISVRPVGLLDIDEARQLFYDTITTVNVKDYTPAQIVVWSSGYLNTERWQNRVNEQYFIAACIGAKMIGIASLADSGYLDLMYVHRDHQGQRIASILLEKLEARAHSLHLDEIYADVSITARPFFLSKGFTIRERSIKMIKDIAFDNAILQKVLS